MISRYALLAVLILFSPFSLAVCPDGENILGIESCALSDISLSIPALARVSQLQEFTLGEFDYETPPQAINDFCIWYNTEQFAMTINSANRTGDNTFGLIGSNTAERIPYQVTWYDQAGSSGNELILTALENIPQQQLSLPQRPADSNCSTNNVSLNITVPLQNLEDKPEDSYSDTLTVTVSVQ